MSAFAFRAVDLAGVPARGEMEASSKAAVSEQLRQRGLIVLDISEKREAMKLESIFQRFKSVNLRALAVFSRQFATLIASGMPMLRSLYTLEAQTEDEMLEKAIIGVREDVEAGSSVAQAMESQPGCSIPSTDPSCAPERTRDGSRMRSTESPISSSGSTPCIVRCARR